MVGLGLALVLGGGLGWASRACTFAHPFGGGLGSAWWWMCVVRGRVLGLRAAWGLVGYGGVFGGRRVGAGGCGGSRTVMLTEGRIAVAVRGAAAGGGGLVRRLESGRVGRSWLLVIAGGCGLVWNGPAWVGAGSVCSSLMVSLRRAWGAVAGTVVVAIVDEYRAAAGVGVGLRSPVAGGVGVAASVAAVRPAGVRVCGEVPFEVCVSEDAFVIRFSVAY